MKRFENDYLIEKTNAWLDNCLNDLRLSVSNTFKYINNIKNLTIIRDSIIEFESSIQLEQTSPISNQQNTWSQICQSLFNKQFDIWSQLISTFYYEQSKVNNIIIIMILKKI